MIITNPPKIAKGHAHSKLILIGEHAVVYGKPAIAIPFPLQVTSSVESRDGKIMLSCSHYEGPIDHVPKQFRGITFCIKETLTYLQKPIKGLLIRLESEIPIGRGLGSSAAIAIAIVKGLFSFYEKSISQKELMALVQVAEEYAHGNPSGIDMAAASSEAPIWFQKNQEILSLQVGTPLHLVVADSGHYGDTLSAVNRVSLNVRLEPEKMMKTIDQIGKIASMAKSALTAGNERLLGRLLNRNHEELKTLGVSDPTLNYLVETARTAGALGAKLTGGGCGGCIIALAQSPSHSDKIANSLYNAGAHHAWHFVLKEG